MANEKDPPDPPVVPEVISPPPKPPSDIEHERWWRAYLALPEPKSPRRLATAVKASIHRIRHACRVGWPEIGCPPFESRARDAAEAQTVAVREVARQIPMAESATVAILEGWHMAAHRHMEALADVQTTIRQITKELAKASAEATFTTYRRVPELLEDGTPLRDDRGNACTKLEKYVPAETVARATARVAAAAKDHAILHKALLDSMTPFKDAAIDLSDAPPEALGYLVEKFGGMK